MSVPERWARTEGQIVLMYQARRQGGLCAWCGKRLDDGETVYIEQFLTGERPSERQGTGAHRSIASAPVGIECASPELLEQTEGQAPEPCAHCGRGVFYREARARRQQTSCSGRCRSRLALAKRAATLGSRP
jgi:hypothetical protein